MKTKILFTLLVCLLGLTMNAQEGERYLVRHIKFKKGMADKAMEMGMKYMNGQSDARGIKVSVIRFRTGHWDALVMQPLRKGETIDDMIYFDDPTPWQEMIKIAGGSEEKLIADMRHYWDAVEEEEITFATRVSEH